MGEAVRRAGSGRRSPEAVQLGAQDGTGAETETPAGGTLENAQAMAAHESPRTTKGPPQIK